MVVPTIITLQGPFGPFFYFEKVWPNLYLFESPLILLLE